MATALEVDGGNVRFRQPGRGITAALLVTVGVLCLVTVLGFGRPPGWIRVLDAALVVFVVAAAVAQLRAGITVDRDGLVARTQLGRRNHRLAWADVDHFEVRGYWRGLCAVTRDGRLLSLMVFGWSPSSAVGVWRELEDVRWQQQQQQALGLA